MRGVPAALSLPAGDEREFGSSLGASCWLITDGKIGDEIPARGVAEAMGLAPTLKRVRPRRLFAALAPWGFADPRDARIVLGSPYPKIAFAAGRRTVPYLRALKRASPKTFTVFFGHPRTARHGADTIWSPVHDGFSGAEMIATATTPHTHSPAALAQAREHPHPRVAALPKPFVGLLIGGPSRHHRFELEDITALCDIAGRIRAQGFGLAVTGSRRTPPALMARLRETFASDANTFIWDGAGANPYGSILANAKTLVVTADSTNMVSEALAAGVPVHLYEPTGGHPKFSAFWDGLLTQGVVRRWAGEVGLWPTAPIDATPVVAAEIARRFALFNRP